MTYDLVIIGAGTAGMTCAIEAAQNGATVAVIEKDTRPGGAMHWSGGHMSAGGTRLQKRNNIQDSVSDHLADILSINNGTGDKDLIARAVNEAPVTLDWLDGLGFPWAPECPRIIYGHVPYKKPRTQYGVNKAISIFETILPLWDAQVEAGNIVCFYEHSFANLKKTADTYSQVVGTNSSGTFLIDGRSIVLTTGGYGSNPDLFMEKHGNIPLVSSTYPNSTGEALVTMENLGAAFRMQDYHLPSLGGMEMEPGSGRANFNEAWAMVLTSVYRKPRDIYVTAEGKRFMNEDEIDADKREREVIKLKDWMFWVIFDEAALMERDESGNENPIVIGWDTERIKTEAKKCKAIFVADSIAELCNKTGIVADNLEDTILKFNDMVDNGDDPDFQRTHLEHKIEKAPFYALKVHASVLVTFGGLTVNSDLQVLDTEGKIMKGVYAAGEALGLGALSGNAFCSGMAITPALSFGRLIGRQLTT